LGDAEGKDKTADDKLAEVTTRAQSADDKVIVLTFEVISLKDKGKDDFDKGFEKALFCFLHPN